MLGSIGPLEIAIVVIIALVVFGPKRLPELGSGLGRGMREFKETLSGERKGEPSEAEATKVLAATSAPSTQEQTTAAAEHN